MADRTFKGPKGNVYVSGDGRGQQIPPWPTVADTEKTRGAWGQFKSTLAIAQRLHTQNEKRFMAKMRNETHVGPDPEVRRNQARKDRAAVEKIASDLNLLWAESYDSVRSLEPFDWDKVKANPQVRSDLRRELKAAPSEGKRMEMLRDENFLAAALEDPTGALTGLSKVQYAGLRERAIEAAHPDAIAAHKAFQEAQQAVESALKVVNTQIENELTAAGEPPVEVKTQPWIAD